ncbi:hypothetical protein JCM8097_002098 [Rhodosporidiobolus ruineniae]
MLDSLRTWLTQNRTAIDHRLELTQLPDGSAAVYARGDIPLDCTVARIPKHLVLSHRSSSLSPSEPHANALAHAPLALRLAVHVLHEVLRGSDSFWAPYLAASPPEEEVPIAVLWEEGSEAAQWARGTQLEKEVRKADITRTTLSAFYYSHALPILSASSSTYICAPTLPAFLHAYTLVSTRAFLVDSTFHTLALVPLADLFNHEQEGVHNVHFATAEQWVCGECGSVRECEHDRAEGAPPPPPCAGEDDEEEDKCDMVTNLPIAAGDEVFNHYGPRLSNAKLAARYGFLLEANEWDVVDFSLDDVLSALELDAERREEVERRWQEALGSAELKEQLGEEHPLIAPPPSTSDGLADAEPERPTALAVDADARLSYPLWLLLALVALPPPASSASSASRLARLAHAIELLAEDDALDLLEDDLAAAGRLSKLVDRLVQARFWRERDPHRSATDLLELAEKTPDRAIRLAISFLAGERLLLERLQQNWTFA